MIMCTVHVVLGSPRVLCTRVLGIGDAWVFERVRKGANMLVGGVLELDVEILLALVKRVRQL